MVEQGLSGDRWNIIWGAQSNRRAMGAASDGENAMNARVEKLSLFFEEVKTLSFWRRVFRWAQLRALSYEAYEEFKSLLSQLSQLSQNAFQAANDISILNKDNEHLKTTQSTLDCEVFRCSL